MNDAEELEESLISIDEDIEHILKNRITRPYSTCKNIGERLWGLEGHYRTRGTLKFLLEADADAFFADLAREALTYRTLLKAYEAKLQPLEQSWSQRYAIEFFCDVFASYAVGAAY